MKYHRIVIVSLATVLLGSIALSYSTGPPDEYTGAPDEEDCTVCHSSFPLNSGDGSLTILGPATYTPGESIDFTVHLRDLGQLIWGFEVTVLNAMNQPAGTLVAVDALRTKKSLAMSGREYIKQTREGSWPDSEPESYWDFRWTASGLVSGPITFYAAGCAANDAQVQLGDFIYTTSKTVLQAIGCCLGRVGDANQSGDDEPTIGDVTTIIDAKFITGSCDGIISCLSEADINQSGGVAPTCDDITIGDITILIDYLFITGPTLGLPECL
jgi:hypothetical protein